MLKRQEAWYCVKRYAIFSLWKCIPFSKMLLKMIFAFQSHQAMPGYMVSYHSQSARQVVLLGMLCLLIGRICSAKEGMMSNRFGPWVLWTFDIPASGNVKKKKQLRNTLQNIRVLSSVWKGTGIAQNLSQQFQKQTAATESPWLVPSHFLLSVVPFYQADKSRRHC